MDFPIMYSTRQTFDAPKIDDVAATVRQEITDLKLRVSPGARIAITAGSRGIRNIDTILKTIVILLKEMGAAPFIVPAMGSHGNGTAEGQAAILNSLGINETAMGAPVRPGAEVVRIGTSSNGFPVLVDKFAAEADGLVVVNRIKPHTEFEGPVESGLMKMMAIGLGNHEGCFQVHKQTVNYGYSKVIREIGSLVLDRLPTLFGLGIVENIHDATALIRASLPRDFIQTETGLLQHAKRLMARLPFEAIDLLILDEMGKNISGTGMDTNVIGRIMFIGEKEPARPRITRIVTLGLTKASHGNAIGIGLADFTTRRVIGQLDLDAMATNAITAMTPEKARLPIAMATDRDAVAAALNTIGAVPAHQARIVHVKNTLELDILHVSQALKQETESHPHMAPPEKRGPLSFDAAGNIVPVAP